MPFPFPVLVAALSLASRAKTCFIKVNAAAVIASAVSAGGGGVVAVSRHAKCGALNSD